MSKLRYRPTEVPGVADLHRVTAVYRQAVDAVSDESRYVPDQIVAFLAQLIARASASYFGHLPQMIKDVAAAFQEVDVDLDAARLYADDRFSSVPPYQIGEATRRRPAPFEAVVETARRLRDLEGIEQAIDDATVGAVLGGSASYGRFFNVKGARESDASDLDLLVVVDRCDDIGNVLDLLGQLPFVDSESAARHRARAVALVDSFSSRDLDPSETVFSCKLNLWTEGEDEVLASIDVSPQYDVSFHFVTQVGFASLLLASSPLITREAFGGGSTVVDVRESAAARKDHQRDFSGSNRRFDLEEVEAPGLGYLRTVSVYNIDQDRFYPGIFQNLVLPLFDARWGSTGLRREVEAFRWKIVERLRYEQTERPHEYLRLSLSHTRSSAFSPYTVRSVDQSTVLS